MSKYSLKKHKILLLLILNLIQTQRLTKINLQRRPIPYPNDNGDSTNTTNTNTTNPTKTTNVSDNTLKRLAIVPMGKTHIVCKTCDKFRSKMACGSDGKTYRNFCRTFCNSDFNYNYEDYELRLRYYGACRNFRDLSCGMDGHKICGSDGNYYLNKCWLNKYGGPGVYDLQC